MRSLALSAKRAARPTVDRFAGDVEIPGIESITHRELAPGLNTEEFREGVDFLARFEQLGPTDQGVVMNALPEADKLRLGKVYEVRDVVQRRQIEDEIYGQMDNIIADKYGGEVPTAAFQYDTDLNAAALNDPEVYHQVREAAQAVRGGFPIEQLDPQLAKRVSILDPQQVEIGGKVYDDILGAGKFGAVVPSETVGFVEKLQKPVVWFKGRKFDNKAQKLAEHEADAMLAVQKLGIAPRVDSLELNPDGSSIIRMQDVRDNYEPGDAVVNRIDSDKRSATTQGEFDAAAKAEAKLGMEIEKQKGMAALAGVDLGDRHSGNYQVHKMMDRPIQLDFGRFTSDRGDQLDLETKIRKVGDASFAGLHRAGLHDEADILEGLVVEAYNNGDMEGAWDLARQGFAQLQKIKQPIPGVPTIIGQ